MRFSSAGIWDHPSQWSHTSLHCRECLAGRIYKSRRRTDCQDRTGCSGGSRARVRECCGHLSDVGGEASVNSYRFCTSAKKSLHLSTSSFAVGYFPRSTSCDWGSYDMTANPQAVTSRDPIEESSTREHQLSKTATAALKYLDWRPIEHQI